MNQILVTEKLYVTRQTVSNYETGRSRPDVDTLIRIAEIYGVGVNQLIYGENEMTRTMTVMTIILICFCVVAFAAFIILAKKRKRVIATILGFVCAGLIVAIVALSIWGKPIQFFYRLSNE